MKTCPRCGERAFDDQDTCYQCMGSLAPVGETGEKLDLSSVTHILESLEGDPEETILVPAPAKAVQAKSYRVLVMPACVSGSQFLLPGKEGELLTIGRAKGNDVVIEDQTVSRHHARLRVAGGKVWVEDLGSRNHTFLDGARLAGRKSLQKGQVLEVGSTKISLL